MVIPGSPDREMLEALGQNRAMACDPRRNLVSMVLGEGSGNLGRAVGYALENRRSLAS